VMGGSSTEAKPSSRSWLFCLFMLCTVELNENVLMHWGFLMYITLIMYVVDITIWHNWLEGWRQEEG
jgi:hypothetical protein